MRKQWKGFVCGILVSVMVLGFGVPALATTVKQLNASYSGIKITLDGEFITPKNANGTIVEPFTVNGTTYLPVRAIANALGLEVEWDGETKTVILESPDLIKQGTVVYDDQYVTISFDKIQEADQNWLCESEAVFIVENKTDFELTFQSEALSFNGISYEVLVGSDSVAPNSTGKVTFGFAEEVPTNVSISTGAIKVIDFSYELFGRELSYDAKWVGK